MLAGMVGRLLDYLLSSADYSALSQAGMQRALPLTSCTRLLLLMLPKQLFHRYPLGLSGFIDGDAAC